MMSDISDGDLDTPIDRTGQILSRAMGKWAEDTGIPSGTAELILFPVGYDGESDPIAACTIIPFPATRRGFKTAYRLGRLLNRFRGEGWSVQFQDELFPCDREIAGEILLGVDHPAPAGRAAA